MAHPLHQGQSHFVEGHSANMLSLPPLSTEFKLVWLTDKDWPNDQRLLVLRIAAAVSVLSFGQST